MIPEGAGNADFLGLGFLSGKRFLGRRKGFSFIDLFWVASSGRQVYGSSGQDFVVKGFVEKKGTWADLGFGRGGFATPVKFSAKLSEVEVRPEEG